MKATGVLLVSMVMLIVWAEDKLPPGVDRRMYCETCLATVTALKTALQEQTGELSGTKIKAETSKICAALTFKERGFPGDKAHAACKHFLDFYEDKLEEVFLKEKVDTIEANLCYLHTTACTGVRRKSFQLHATMLLNKANHMVSQTVRYEIQVQCDACGHGTSITQARTVLSDESSLQEQEHTFEDRIIEEVIQKHADRVRRSNPKFAESNESLYHAKEEL